MSYIDNVDYLVPAWRKYFELLNYTILKNETFLEFYEYIRDNNETMDISKIKEVASKLKLDRMFIGEEYKRVLAYGKLLISLTDEKIKKEFDYKMYELSYFREKNQNKEKEYIIDFRSRVHKSIPAILRRNITMLKCIGKMDLYADYCALYKDDASEARTCICKCACTEFGILNHAWCKEMDVGIDNIRTHVEYIYFSKWDKFEEIMGNYNFLGKVMCQTMWC